MDTLKEWALYYASIGLPVFPLIQNTKRPAVTKGFHSATTDTATIERWWAEHPSCNIGVATGNGLVCIDLDCKNDGEDGAETLRSWEREHGKLPDTWRCITPTGSTHIYYRTTENIGVVNHGPVFPDIDIHGSGAYMVLPPSKVMWNGKTCEYLWECGFSPEETQLTEADSVVKEFLHSAFKRVETSTQEGSSEKHQKTIMPDVIKAGERHSQLVSLAGALRAKNLSEKAILEALTAENDEKCEDPKMSDKDIQKLVKWVMTKDTSEAQIEAERIAKEEAQKKAQAESEATLSSALVSLDDVETKEAEWLIPGVIPRGQICLLVADGGTGKTWLWCDVAAKLSAGKKCILDDPEIPFKVRDPARVMFFSSEDSVSSVLKPRLALAGANFSNITTITLENDAFPQVKIGNPAFESLLAKVRPELCVFDPLQSFISDKIKMAERNAMRQALTPLIGYGEEYGTSFLVICHSNKRNGASGRLRVADSADIWDIARCVLLAGETGDEGIKYISQEKNNYGPCVNTILFSINPSGKDGQILKFEGTSKKKDYDYVTERDRTRRSAPERDEATNAIENLIGFAGGHMLTSELKDAVIKGYDIKPKTYERARKGLLDDGVLESVKIGKNNWYTAVAGWAESLTKEERLQLAKTPQAESQDKPETVSGEPEQLTLEAL